MTKWTPGLSGWLFTDSRTSEGHGDLWSNGVLRDLGISKCAFWFMTNINDFGSNDPLLVKSTLGPRPYLHI
jgi:hypothetical protein